MSETPMLIEGMKELNLILKRMAKNAMQIQEYAAQPSVEKPIFESASDQVTEVTSLAQSSEDLATRYAELHARIAYTNLMTRVSFGGREWSIHELLVYKRKLAKAIEQSYAAMNDNAARMKLRGMAVAEASIDRYYDERTRNERLRYWEDLYEGISGRLEVVNATTPLAALPAFN